MPASKVTTLLTSKHKELGELGAFYGGTSSDTGAWLGGNDAYGPPTLLFTADGVRFEKRKPPELHMCSALLALPDGRLLAGGWCGLAVSTDGGKKWARVPTWNIAGRNLNQVWSLALVDGTIWAAGQDLIASSQDGVTWRRSVATNEIENGINGMCVSGERAFAVAGEALYERKGEKLVAVKTFTEQPLQNIAAGPNGFVIVGNEGFVARSKDGARWTTTIAGKANLHRVRWIGDRFLIVGERGAIYETVDGTKLTKIPSGTDADGWSIVPFRDGVFVGGELHAKVGPARHTGGLIWLGGARKAYAVRAVPTIAIPSPRERTPYSKSKRKKLGITDHEQLAAKAAIAKYPVLRKLGVEASDVVHVYGGDLVVDRFATRERSVRGRTWSSTATCGSQTSSSSRSTPKTMIASRCSSPGRCRRTTSRSSAIQPSASKGIAKSWARSRAAVDRKASSRLMAISRPVPCS